MTVYLQPEVKSGLGEDTFWTWFAREFPDSSFDLPSSLKPGDLVLQYSTLGRPRFPEQTVSLLWELYPEMKARLGSSQWDGIIARIMESGAARWRTVASPIMAPYYEHLGKIDVLPIGVDTELFRIRDKAAMRRKHGLAPDKTIVFWSGTRHPMKGFDRLQTFAADNPLLHWVIAWKHPDEPPWIPEHAGLGAVRNFHQVPQETLAELMSACDCMLSPGRLRPYFMVEWEAMACDLFTLAIDSDSKGARGLNQTLAIWGNGWSRTQARKTWAQYLEECSRCVS